MRSSIDRVRSHAAHEAESERQNASKIGHARADHFASTHYNDALIRHTRAKGPPTKSPLPKKLTKRPDRTATAHASSAVPKQAHGPKPHTSVSAQPRRDPYRQGGGGGGSGNQRGHDDDDSDDGADTESARSGKFSVSSGRRPGTLVTLPDDAQVYAASVSTLPNRRSLLFRHAIERLKRLFKEPTFTQAQTESHHLLAPLMAHQAVSLPRSRSQLLNALARKESQVRSCPTASSSAIHGALLDNMLAASDRLSDAPASDDAPRMADLFRFLGEARAPK